MNSPATKHSGACSTLTRVYSLNPNPNNFIRFTGTHKHALQLGECKDCWCPQTQQATFALISKSFTQRAKRC
jgi:hypothetical protein